MDVGTSASSNLQDILRLLTLWFSYGAAPDVEAALAEGFGHVSIDTWLVVIPQVRVAFHNLGLSLREYRIARERQACASWGCPTSPSAAVRLS